MLTIIFQIIGLALILHLYRPSVTDSSVGRATDCEASGLKFKSNRRPE